MLRVLRRSLHRSQPKWQACFSSAQSPCQDKIVLHNMVFVGRHGVHAAEHELGQKFIVDAELSADLSRAGQTDDLQHTIDYSKAYDRIRGIVEGPTCSLIEAVASRISKSMFEMFPAVTQVTVRVKKPQVALPGILDYSGVEITRTRSTSL